MTDPVRMDEAAIAEIETIGGAALLGDLVAILRRETPTRLAEARTHWERRDAQALHRAVHGLRSAAAGLGCTAAVHHIDTIEAHARADRLVPNTGEALDQLDRAMAQSLHWLQARVAAGHS